MVLTISPRFGGHDKRISKWREWTLMPFALGASASGAGVFALAGAAGSAVVGDGVAESTVNRVAWVALAGVAAAYGLSYIVRRPLAVPNTRRQVPKLWREAFAPAVAALLYGLGLGIGFFTKVPHVTFYLALTAAALVGDPSLAALAGVSFGLARTLPLVPYRVHGLKLGESVAEDLNPWAARIEIVNGGALLMVTAVVFVGAM